MANTEFKEKHSRRLRDKYLKTRDNDNKGVFKLKDLDPRKQEYKRSRLRVTEVFTDEEG